MDVVRATRRERSVASGDTRGRTVAAFGGVAIRESLGDDEDVGAAPRIKRRYIRINLRSDSDARSRPTSART